MEAVIPTTRSGVRICMIGNCQVSSIGEILLEAVPNAVILPVRAVHSISEADYEALHAQMGEADLILQQPIGNEFKHQFVSTASVKKNFPGKSIVIPNLYFRGYHSDIDYLRLAGGSSFQGPLADYHSTIILRSFLENTSIEECERRFHDADYLTSLAYDQAAASLDELEQRDRFSDIGMTSYIREHYRFRKLFHTVNHPAKELLVNIVQQVVRLAGLQTSTFHSELLRDSLSKTILPIVPGLAERMQISEPDVYRGIRRSSASGSTRLEYSKIAHQYTRTDLIKEFYELYENERSWLADHAIWQTVQIRAKTEADRRKTAC